MRIVFSFPITKHEHTSVIHMYLYSHVFSFSFFFFQKIPQSIRNLRTGAVFLIEKFVIRCEIEKLEEKRDSPDYAKGAKSAQRHYGANLEKRKKKEGKGRGWNGMIRCTNEEKERKEKQRKRR